MLAHSKQVLLSRTPQINSWSNCIPQEKQIRKFEGWFDVQKLYLKEKKMYANDVKPIIL